MDGDRIQVQMPDGTVIDAPAGVTKAQIAAKYQAAGKSVDIGHWYDPLVDQAKLIGTAAYKGLASLPAMAADALNADPQIRMAQAAAGQKPANVADMPLTTALGKSGYQPKTTAEKLESAAISGATGSLLGPAGGLMAPVRTAVVGGTAGLGSELAATAFGDNPWVRLAGGAVGGAGAGVAAAVKGGNTAKLAQEAVRDVKPQDLKAAQANMILARQQGVPVNASQAMPVPSNIDTLVDTLANSRYGTKITSQLRNQPDQVAMGMEDQLLNLPGQVRAPQVVANNAQDVATRVINGAKSQRQSAWESTFNKGVDDLKLARAGEPVPVSKASSLVDSEGNPIVTTTIKDGSELASELPQSAVKSAYDKLGALAAERPNTGLGDALSDLQSRLKSGDGFITDANKLNDILKDATAKLKSPTLATQGIDAGASKYMGSVISSLRDDWGAQFAPYRDANAVYQQLTDDVVNPLKKSVIGDLAGRRGALPDVEAVKSKVASIFNRGTVPGAKSSDILTMEQRFRSLPQTADSVSGAEAFQDAAKTWMADKISNAARQEGGRIDQNIAGRLENVFLGNDTAARGFKDTLVGLARSQGLKDDALLPGMMNFMKTVSMAARRPGSVQGVSTSGARAIAGESVATASGATITNPVRNVMQRWSMRLQANAYREMDRLLTSPEGIDTLQKLAKVPPMSPAAQNLMATFLGTEAATNAGGDPPQQ